MPSPIAASAVPASGKAAAAAKAKPTMSFRSIHFLLFRDAGRRPYGPAKGPPLPDVLSDVQSPDPVAMVEGDRPATQSRDGRFKATDVPEEEAPPFFESGQIRGFFGIRQ